jgi:Ca-activated chloride channel homolog
MQGFELNLKRLFAATVFIVFPVAAALSAFGQTACLSDEEARKMIAQLNSPPEKTVRNKDLQDELLKMKADLIALNQKILSGNSEKEKASEALTKLRAKNEARLCQIFRQNGWLSADAVGADGVSAALFIIRTGFSVQSLQQLLPVLNLALKKDEIEKNEDLAALIDLLFLRSGQKQLFGTQTYISENFLVLAPLQSEAKVDEWRERYKMPPLADYIRFIQRLYRMPLIKATSLSNRNAPENSALKEEKPLANGILASEEEEVIRVDSGLVNLNVSVLGKDAKTFSGALNKEDFKVFEDGREQEISFFARHETPFDLVLLLDLSGSTADKTGLIRKSARRFIESKRPIDRVAIVTFSTEATVVSPLTEDRERLLEAAKKIEGRGGSNVWDALDFTLENVLDKKESGRQRAVVFMTDGEETALQFYPGYGSKTLFADLLEKVRADETVIVPIYLDSEKKDAEARRVARDARNTLALLASESGGTLYRAQRIEDLEGVYEQVLNDLSKTYNLGYIPENARRDGSWRTIKVEIPSRPDLVVRTKKGYYAK